MIFINKKTINKPLFLNQKPIRFLKPYRFALIFFLFFSLTLHAQEDEDELPEATREYIENIVGDSDSDFDFDGIFDVLRGYRRKALNLNRASEEELADLRLLNSIQITSLLEYRATIGILIDIRELQAVPEFDLETINRILPYVGVQKNAESFNVPVGKMLYLGRNDLTLRYSRILEPVRGFTPVMQGDSNRYVGTPGRVYARFKHTYENRHSWGITMEKDPGEEFFKGSNKAGFDFYSAHVYYRNISRTVKALALGDFQVSLGQGLIAAPGFGTGKTSFVTDIRSGGRVISAYTSVNESLFFRGLGGTLALSDNIALTAFGSYRARDAVAIDAGASDIDFVEGVTFSSLQVTGLHRTPTELLYEGGVREGNIGGSLKYKTRKFHIAANGMYTKFDDKWQRRQDVYSQYRFTGDRLAQMSLDYGIIFRNINFFGETAYSNANVAGLATLNGVLIGLDRTVNLAILHRHYQKEHNTLYGNPFAETSGGSNETGLYMGLDIKPNYNWQLSAYFDTWSHPWLRASIDAPSTGYEYLVQATYRVKRRMEIYIRFRDEMKSINVPGNETAFNYLTPQRRTNIRLHITNKVNKALELKNRVELIYFDREIAPVSKGFLLYQDVVYKPVDIPFSFTTRFAVFDTDDYSSRAYAYENDLIGFFSVPPYAYKGTRFYFNLRYRGTRNMTIEARIAQTYLRDRDFFGSGLQEIEGRKRTEIKAQVKYKF